MSAQLLTYKLQVRPRRHQYGALARILEQQRELYNAALAVRIECYRRYLGSSVQSEWDEKKGRYVLRRIAEPAGPLRKAGLSEQMKELTELRAENADYAATARRIQAETLRRLDRAQQAFFRRVKQGGEAPGFPRFKGREFFTGFGFDAFRHLNTATKNGKKFPDTAYDGGFWDGKRLRFKGMPGGLRVLGRPMPEGAQIRNIQFTREGRRWYACFQTEVPVQEEPAERGLVIGIDSGVRNSLTLSNGVSIPCPKHLAAGLAAIQDAQRAVSKEKKGSRQRRKAREKLAYLHRKVRNRRANFLHKQSKLAVTHFRGVAIETLPVKAMAMKTSREESAGKRENLNRHLLDAAPAMLLGMLRYKAVRHGARLWEIDPPKNTARECFVCGEATECPPDMLDYICGNPNCGAVTPRARNSALVILLRAMLRDGRVPAASNGCEIRQPETVDGPRGRMSAPYSHTNREQNLWRRVKGNFLDAGWV